MKAAAILLVALAGAAAQPPRELETAPPALVHQVEPQYTPEALAHGMHGAVLLYVAIDPSGKPAEIKVLRGLGMGLDEKAVEAVKQWRFRPALRMGRSVSTAVTIRVWFRLPADRV